MKALYFDCFSLCSCRHVPAARNNKIFFCILVIFFVKAQAAQQQERVKQNLSFGQARRHLAVKIAPCFLKQAPFQTLFFYGLRKN